MNDIEQTERHVDDTYSRVGDPVVCVVNRNGIPRIGERGIVVSTDGATVRVSIDLDNIDTPATWWRTVAVGDDAPAPRDGA